jgi:hydroxyacylglutathione hydrolase
MLHVTPVSAFRDNYIWIIQPNPDSRQVAIVDPGDAAPVIEAIEEHGWAPGAILLTHHHFDHVGGVLDLVSRYPVPVYGPDNSAIKGVTHVARSGDRVHLDELGLTFEVDAIPGHTLDHIYYYGHGALFCGDTLFSAGCGRLFEGTAQQMQASLARLRDMPDATRVYCAHEYTQSNLQFASAVEPDNPAIDDYIEFATRLRVQHMPTLPSHMALEKKVNPFLRWDHPDVRQAAMRHASAELSDDASVFAALRSWKDEF